MNKIPLHSCSIKLKVLETRHCSKKNECNILHKRIIISKVDTKKTAILYAILYSIYMLLVPQ